MDFQFLQNPISKNWVISAPRRAKRPDVAKGAEPLCPFCIGREHDEPEVFRIPARNASAPTSQMLADAGGGGEVGDSNWQVRVVPNKFPFAPIHEIVIHSPDHHKNFDELPDDAVVRIVEAYRQRFMTHKDKGQVVIFNNHGEVGGESLPHPHTQIAVVPKEVRLDTPRLEEVDIPESQGKAFATGHFSLSAPKTSQWPDEVWVMPQRRGRVFFEVTAEEIIDLASIIQILTKSFTQIYGHEFPYNFYIYPGGDWYLRFIPRSKSIGGFELSTGIMINTKDPRETIEFLRSHFLTKE